MLFPEGVSKLKKQFCSIIHFPEGVFELAYISQAVVDQISSILIDKHQETTQQTIESLEANTTSNTDHISSLKRVSHQSTLLLYHSLPSVSMEIPSYIFVITCHRFPEGDVCRKVVLYLLHKGIFFGCFYCFPVQLW